MATDILSISEIIETQDAKYLTHNEALRQIEAMLVRVLSRTNGGAPATPANGDVYIVDDASGDWLNATVNDLAHYYSSAWHFYTPVEGLLLWCVDEDLRIHYDGTIWTESFLTIYQQSLSADPADPAAGQSVQWLSDGTGSGDAGDVMMKINVGGVVKTITLVDYSAN